jgi:hypothetical protein
VAVAAEQALGGQQQVGQLGYFEPNRPTDMPPRGAIPPVPIRAVSTRCWARSVKHPANGYSFSLGAVYAD